MVATETTLLEQYAEALGEREHMLYDDLPKELQDTATLTRAVKEGVLELGRRNHSFHAEIDPKDETKTKYLPGGQQRFHVNDGWSWTDCMKRGYKNVPGILKEFKSLPSNTPVELKLHVRIKQAL